MKGKRKSGLQRRVLAASVILSLLIVVGGTFAWFTSYDEVVNKLTAVYNYGVSITEEFTAPENWLPGQEVNKDVQAVNTGNVDDVPDAWGMQPAVTLTDGKASVVAWTPAP